MENSKNKNISKNQNLYSLNRDSEKVCFSNKVLPMFVFLLGVPTAGAFDDFSLVLFAKALALCWNCNCIFFC